MSTKQKNSENSGRRVKVDSLPKGERAETAEGSENRKKWAALVAQAWADEKFKKRLIEKPAAVLQEQGIEVPEGINIRVLENTENVTHLILPPKPAGEVSELTASQMKGVMGGRVKEERPVKVVVAVTGDSKPMGYWEITVDPPPQSGQCYSSCVLSM